MTGGAATVHVVTGGFGYTGRYIVRRLLSEGQRVRTLIAHPDRPNPFGNQVKVAFLNFDNRGQIQEALQGAAVLYNTYWVRFPYAQATFEKAIANTRTLIAAAKAAGVRRIVHLSVTNASKDSALPYFRGKAVLEDAVRESRLSYAILRPTVIFGVGDILINNIAWLLRRAPLFVVPGSGDHRLQPVFVEDVAELAVRAAGQPDDVVVDAAGPEVYTFDGLVRLLAAAVGSRARITHAAPRLALFLASLLGRAVRDVLLTREELAGLMANLLISAGSPTGRTRFSDWLEQNAHRVGIQYASELERHYR